MAQTATKDAPTERPNKVKITDSGPSSKKIWIEIPAATVAEQLGTSLDALMGEAEIPGFRKGHVPRRLIEKKFGTTVRREAKNQLVATAYSKAIEEHKIRVIGEPRSEELAKAELVDGKPLAFEVEVEVLPAFELPSLDGIAIRKPIIEVTDEMVQKDFDRILMNEGKLEPKEKIEKGDYLTGHAVMKDTEGTTHLDINDAVIQVPTADKAGKGMILGVLVEDFADQIGKPKVGDTLTIKTKGPESHETEAVRGKDLVITFEIGRADQIIPANVADVAARFGMETEADIRKAVRERLEQRVQLEQQSSMRQQIAMHMLENVKMELPERVTAEQSERNLQRRRMDLMHRGMETQQIEEHMAELRAASSESAMRELKIYFALDKAAEELEIKVSDAEINGRIAQIAMSRGERPEKLRQEIIQRNQVGVVFQQLREHKTMDAILAKAKIEEVSIEEFNKGMEARNAALGGGSAAKPKPAPKKKEAAKKDDDEKPAAAESKSKKAPAKKSK